MRFQVPQFVDIRDKVIGPLTLKQFAYYIVAMMFIGLYYIMFDLGLMIIFALPTLGVAALFAHGKFYGQTFTTLLLHGFQFITGSRLYLWRRTAQNKPLNIRGTEYNYDGQEANAPTLEMMNQALNTEGNIVAEDADDPMLEEKPPTKTPDSKKTEQEKKNKE